MSKKIILSDNQKSDIIAFIEETYQCTISDVQKAFQLSRHVLENNFGKEFLSSKMFKGVKDSTKDKLSEINKGKTLPEETKQRISSGVKQACTMKTDVEKHLSYEKSVQTKIEKFGSWEAYSEHQVKASKQTKKNLYGNENYNNVAKNKATKLERYGDENYNNQQQIAETQYKLYGGYAFCDKEKTSNTMLDKYGVAHNWASSDDKLNGRATRYEKFGGKENYYIHVAQKSRNTKLELYGDEFFSNTEQAQKTMLEKYGVPFYTMTEDCRIKSSSVETQNKRENTRRKNGTFNTSNDESLLYDILTSHFGGEDIVREYQDDRYSDNGYHFKCDFYIKSLDMFIELNYHPTHGKHPFNEQDDNDVRTLQLLNENQTQWNKNVVDVWTVRDVAKRNIAIKNNLNYIAIYPDMNYNDIITIIEKYISCGGN